VAYRNRERCIHFIQVLKSRGAIRRGGGEKGKAPGRRKFLNEILSREVRGELNRVKNSEKGGNLCFLPRRGMVGS